ncbi:MFS transporter [Nonomuraea sp. NPDC050663]|uniref:MFS transporter n=1 Tax=Nonomuraea sp. NPDC050663 TaxID=3364370 RepID=UPI0037AC4DAF
MIGAVPSLTAPYWRLWTARTISFTGDSLSLVALMVHVADSTGRALAVALLLLVGDFAPALLGPLTGAVADRYGRRRVMVGCEVVQGLLVAAIAIWLPPLPVLLVLVGLRAIAGQLFQAASRSVVPELVPDAKLARANTLLGMGTNGGEALGPIAAAALLAVSDIRGVLLVDAATFAVSAVLLLRMPASPSAPEPGGSLLGDTREGLRYIFTTRLVRAVGLGFFSVVLFNGIDDVALVFLATETFDAGDAAAGLLLAGVGIGLFAGYLLLTRTVRLSMVTLLLLGFAVSSAGNLVTGFAWAVWAAMAVQTIRGLGIAAMDVASNTLIQQEVPAQLLGRVFGTLYGAIGVAAAVSYLGGGALLEITSPPVAFVVAGAGGLLATVLTWTALRRVRP